MLIKNILEQVVSKTKFQLKEKKNNERQLRQKKSFLQNNNVSKLSAANKNKNTTIWNVQNLR